MLFVQPSSQDRSQGTFICFLLLECPPVPGRQKWGQVVWWVSDNKTILTDFVLVVLSAWLFWCGGAWGKQGWQRCASQLTRNLPSVASFQALSPVFPASTGFRMSRTLSRGLLRAMAGSEGRRSPSSTPVWCHFSSYTQIENTLLQWVCRKPQQLGMGNAWAQQSLSLCAHWARETAVSNRTSMDLWDV